MEEGEAAAHQEWVRRGLYEHASVASFARHTLDLLAAAAPAVLVSEAQQAATDEINHAQLCFGVANSLNDKRASVKEETARGQGGSRS